MPPPTECPYCGHYDIIILDQYTAKKYGPQKMNLYQCRNCGEEFNWYDWDKANQKRKEQAQ